MSITVERHAGVKCPRCLHKHFHTLNFGHKEGDVDSKGEPVDMTEKLCNRCVAIICKYFPKKEAGIAVLENLASRGMTPQDNPEWNNV